MLYKYMVYVVSHSWNIPYSMKPLLINANEGFGRDINTKSRCCVWYYMHKGKYFDDGGG